MRPYILHFHTQDFNAAACYKKSLSFIEKEGLSARVHETQLLQEKSAMKIMCTIDVTFALENLPFVANILRDRSNDSSPVKFPHAAP